MGKRSHFDWKVCIDNIWKLEWTVNLIFHISVDYYDCEALSVWSHPYNLSGHEHLLLDHWCVPNFWSEVSDVCPVKVQCLPCLITLTVTVFLIADSTCLKLWLNPFFFKLRDESTTTTYVDNSYDLREAYPSSWWSVKWEFLTFSISLKITADSVSRQSLDTDTLIQEQPDLGRRKTGQQWQRHFSNTWKKKHKQSTCVVLSLSKYTLSLT